MSRRKYKCTNKNDLNLQVGDLVDVDGHEIDNFPRGGVFLSRDRDFERLAVDGADEGALDLDGDGVHQVKVSAQTDGLEAGDGEHEDGVEDAAPQGLVFAPDELDDELEQHRRHEDTGVVEQLEQGTQQELKPVRFGNGRQYVCLEYT